MADLQQKQKDNPFLNLIISIVIPSFILIKLSGPDELGQVNALLLAVAFPIGYSIYEFIKQKRASFIAILGFINVLLTGGLGLLAVDGIWFAVKEAAVPTLIGAAVIVSQYTRTPLVRTFLLNPAVMDVDRLQKELEAKNRVAEFDQLLRGTTYLLAASFALSAVLNFVLAVYILESPSGTPEFNAELGKMQALSFPVISLPSMTVLGFALFRLIKGIKALTGLELEQVFKSK